MDEHLDGLSTLVHDVLKRLKMGETGTIICTKEYPSDEVLLYVTGYAMHKEKWFETHYDKASNVVHAKRSPIPNWEVSDVVDPEEEA